MTVRLSKPLSFENRWLKHCARASSQSCGVGLRSSDVRQLYLAPCRIRRLCDLQVPSGDCVNPALRTANCNSCGPALRAHVLSRPFQSSSLWGDKISIPVARLQSCSPSREHVKTTVPTSVTGHRGGATEHTKKTLGIDPHFCVDCLSDLPEAAACDTSARALHGQFGAQSHCTTREVRAWFCVLLNTLEQDKVQRLDIHDSQVVDNKWWSWSLRCFLCQSHCHDGAIASLWRSNVLSILDKKRAPKKPIGRDLQQDQTDCRLSNDLEFRPTMLARQRAQNIARASVA